jgi:GNAT superfamily N-acetyltransferase
MTATSDSETVRRGAAGVTIRPSDPETDFPRLVELIATVEPEPITLEMLREWEAMRSAEEITYRTTAVDGSGRILGFGHVERSPWKKPGRFDMNVLVDPAERGKGIGTLLYEDALRFARENGATRLQVRVRDHMPESLAYVQRRGFETDRHIFESTLDLSTYDEAPFAGALERAEASGIRFTSLAEIGDTEEARYRLYELNRDTGMDIPGRDDPFTPWEEFRKIFGMSWYRADGQVLAVDPAAGNRFVALAALGLFKEKNAVYHMMTGVHRDYRGRGLAQAVKVAALRWAREWGAAYARTNNDSKNEPILAVNRKFGYVPSPGYYLLLRSI